MNVPISSIAAMGISALVCTVFPIVLLIIAVKKYKLRLSPAFIGAGTFILFALILESIMHQLVILKSPVGDSIQNNPWLYALYGGLAAGIFEETGRFVAFKTVMRKSTDIKDSLSYGIGHGGFEAIFVVGLQMASNIVLSVMINSGMSDMLLSSVTGEENIAAVKTQLSTLAETASGMYYLGIIERFSAVALHISLSVLVYIAAKRKNRVWLYPAAILIHAFCDGVLVVLVKRYDVNPILVELILAVLTLAVVFLAVKLYRADREKEAAPKEAQEA